MLVDSQSVGEDPPHLRAVQDESVEELNVLRVVLTQKRTPTTKICCFRLRKSPRHRLRPTMFSGGGEGKERVMGAAGVEIASPPVLPRLATRKGGGSASYEDITCRLALRYNVEYS